MIDIHSHILPGLDDGSPDVDTSLEMARSAAGENVSCIVATPHFVPRWYENDRDTVLRSVDTLNNCIQKENLPLIVVPGVEAYVNIDLPDRVQKGQVLTLNDTGKYLLLEFPMTDIPNYTEQVIFNLMVKGITPIIAHPERNRAVINNPQILHSLLNKGVLVQLTAASLKGVWGKAIQKLSINFLKLGWVHFIATDAHSSSGSRSLLLSKIVPELRNIVGAEQTQTLLFDNPKKVLEGKHIVTDSYKAYKNEDKSWRKLFQFFTS